MKTQTFKEIYAELIIRFGEDWETAEIEEKSYPFDASDLLKGNVKIDELFDGAYRIWNKNGLIYDNGTWATRKLTEAPEKWVVEKDDGHPMWEKFKKWQCENVGNVGFDYKFYNKEHEFDDNLLCFKGHQLITLDQWAEFFLNEPKAGELHLFHDGDGEFSIAKFKEMNTRKGKEIYPFVDEHDHVWKYCDALSDEAQVILNREIENIKAR